MVRNTVVVAVLVRVIVAWVAAAVCGVLTVVVAAA